MTKSQAKNPMAHRAGEGAGLIKEKSYTKEKKAKESPFIKTPIVRVVNPMPRFTSISATCAERILSLRTKSSSNTKMQSMIRTAYDSKEFIQEYK